VEACGLTRLEAALRPPLAHDPPGHERLGEALEPLRPEVVELEQAADQPSRRLADHHGAGLGQGLQPRRQIRHLADHRLVPARAGPDEIAHDRLPSGNPDPRLKADLHAGLQARHGLHQLETRAHRPLSVVFVRARPAEISKRAVAEILGGMAIEALDHGSDSAVVHRHDRAQILGIEARGQLGRADQITEQHGQLPAFRLDRSLRRSRRCGDRRPAFVEPRDRIEQATAMADRGDAERDQVLGGQSRQNLAVNVMGAECLGVTFQAQIPQPGRDVHRRRPGLIQSNLMHPGTQVQRIAQAASM
jgi:hypothetical protein